MKKFDLIIKNANVVNSKTMFMAAFSKKTA
jgi:hypothetical protein